LEPGRLAIRGRVDHRGHGVEPARPPRARRPRAVSWHPGTGLTPSLPDLPIVEILDDVRFALDGHRRAVVSAPPGAGKTTVIPLALLDAPWRDDGTTLMLEPRRLAT